MKKLLTILFISSLIISCDDSMENAEIPGESITLNCENMVLGAGTLINGDAHSGSTFSRLDTLSQCGIGYKYFIPDSLVSTDVKVTVQAFVRSNIVGTRGTIAIALHNNDSVLSWNEIEAKNVIVAASQWTALTGEITFPGSVTNIPNLHIRIFGYKSPQKELFDIDDLKIKISKSISLDN